VSGVIGDVVKRSFSLLSWKQKVKDKNKIKKALLILVVTQIYDHSYEY